MATNAQRTAAICDGMLNKVSTQAQQLELAEALYTDRLPEVPWDELTNAQKAAIIPQMLLEYCTYKVRQLREAKRPPIADPTVDYKPEV